MYQKRTIDLQTMSGIDHLKHRWLCVGGKNAGMCFLNIGLNIEMQDDAFQFCHKHF